MRKMRSLSVCWISRNLQNRAVAASTGQISLRASRQTDLMDQYGLGKACAWIGNSPAVAMKHYALLRKLDYLALEPTAT